MNDSNQLLRTVKISKNFPGVKALSEVDFELDRGEVRALVGENGAGKSTLIKILSGIYQPSSGEIVLNGETTSIHSPNASKKLGIASVQQEVNLEPYLSVAENIFLGRQPMNKFGMIDTKQMVLQASKWLNLIGVDLNPEIPLGMISIADKQMVAIAQAISMDAKIIIFDEPTSSLTQGEANNLFKVIRDLRKNQIGVIYISHRLEEIFRICDSITIMRDGKIVANHKIGEINQDQVISLMVGREKNELFRREKHVFSDEPVLELDSVSVKGILKNISFSLHRKEIFGLYGLVGSGRTELARTIFGDIAYQEGMIKLYGEKIAPKHPSQSIERQIALVPEDRKDVGLFLRQSVRSNISVTMLNKIQKLGFVKEKDEIKLARNYVSKLSIKTPSIEQKVQFLSGGNQQRVVISKWLATNPQILIIDEPTRGIDVGAKVEIHKLIDQLASEGMAILVISSELPEIISLSDRIGVMAQGEICAILSGDEISEENIIRCATGQKLA